MTFEQHLFISYAILDNEEIDGEKGWVTRFHQTLSGYLCTQLGCKPRIWRDVKLSGSDVLSDEIFGRLRKSALLLSILSPRYFLSEWCTREAHEFCRHGMATGQLVVGDKSRVVKVLKTPIEPAHHEALPAPMREMLGYRFFEEADDGVPVVYDPGFGADYAARYRLAVAKLAFWIAQVVKLVEADDSAPVVPTVPATSAVPGRPVVYLAECSYDRRAAREVLEGELMRLGYSVLPDAPLPRDEAEYVAAVEGLLSRSALSIHLVGAGYGFVPDGPTSKSVGMLQNELAVARCGAGLKRLIWLPKDTASDNPQQQAFIDALQRDEQAQRGADLIAGSIEELRAAILTTLKKIEQPKPANLPDAAAAPGTDARKLLYVICNARDRDSKATIPLRKFCQGLGFETRLPVFEGTSAELRQAHEQLLAGCDAVLVFYGAGDEAWKHAIENELRGIAGHRDGKPMPPIVTYLAGPATSAKQDLIDMAEPDLIDGLNGLDQAEIGRFLRGDDGLSA